MLCSLIIFHHHIYFFLSHYCVVAPRLTVIVCVNCYLLFTANFFSFSFFVLFWFWLYRCVVLIICFILYYNTIIIIFKITVIIAIAFSKFLCNEIDNSSFKVIYFYVMSKWDICILSLKYQLLIWILKCSFLENPSLVFNNSLFFLHFRIGL